MIFMAKSTSTNISIRIDTDLKAAAEELSVDIPISYSIFTFYTLS